MRRRTQLLEQITERINQIKTKIDTFPKNDEYNRWQERLCKSLDKTEEEILKKKNIYINIIDPDREEQEKFETRRNTQKKKVEN